MGVAKTKTRFKSGQIVIAIESFNSSALGAPFPVAAGDRFRGDHPIVQACSGFFAPDGTPRDEVQRLRQALIREAEAAIPTPNPLPAPAPRLRDADAVVAISGGGERVDRRSREVKAHPEHYVPVIPAGLKRADALVALAPMSRIGADGKLERALYEGQWTSKDDLFVAINPHQFQLPYPE